MITVINYSEWIMYSRSHDVVFKISFTEQYAILISLKSLPTNITSFHMTLSLPFTWFPEHVGTEFFTVNNLNTFVNSISGCSAVSQSCIQSFQLENHEPDYITPFYRMHNA